MRRLATVLLLPLLAVTACGGGSSSGGAANGSLPTVQGQYGQKPAITFPSGSPTATLQTKVLTAGSGPAVVKGDLLVADYLGQIWHGKVFDNSYDRHQPAAFPIGVGKVIPGWDQSLVGVKAGSRVLVVVPPKDGYGTQGNTSAGIKGTDTLVFVVDVVASYGATSTGDTHATPVKPTFSSPKVTGALGQQPTVTIAKGTPPPKQPTVTVLDRGHGQPLIAGLVVVQDVAVDWTGKVIDSTWKSGVPSGFPIGTPGQPGVADKLVGVPVGSRVLIEVPGQAKTASTSSDAVVVDIIAQPHSAAA